MSKQYVNANSNQPVASKCGSKKSSVTTQSIADFIHTQYTMGHYTVFLCRSDM